MPERLFALKVFYKDHYKPIALKEFRSFQKIENLGNYPNFVRAYSHNVTSKNRSFEQRPEIVLANQTQIDLRCLPFDSILLEYCKNHDLYEMITVIT